MHVLKRMAAFLMAILLLVLAVPSVSETGLVSPEEIRTGDVLCFGTPEEACGYDGKWLVLDGAHTNMGTDGIFLVSLNLIGGENGEPLVFRQLPGDPSVTFSDQIGRASCRERV